MSASDSYKTGMVGWMGYNCHEAFHTLPYSIRLYEQRSKSTAGRCASAPLPFPPPGSKLPPHRPPHPGRDDIHPTTPFQPFHLFLLPENVVASPRDDTSTITSSKPPQPPIASTPPLTTTLGVEPRLQITSPKVRAKSGWTKWGRMTRKASCRTGAIRLASSLPPDPIHPIRFLPGRLQTWHPAKAKSDMPLSHLVRHCTHSCCFGC